MGKRTKPRETGSTKSRRASSAPRASRAATRAAREVVEVTTIDVVASRVVSADGEGVVSNGLNDTDRTIVGFADKTLDEGVQLQRWWEAGHAKGSYGPKLDVIREFNNDDSSFGFFGVAPVGGRDLPVMGIVQEMFYDRQKQATGQTIQPQLKEFVLKHFMRVSHFRQPEAAPAGL